MRLIEAKKRISEHIALRIALPAFLTVVLFVGVIFWMILPALEKSIMEQKRQMAHELTETAWSYMASLHEQELAGELTQEEAQARAVWRIRNLRYGPERKDYFWINDMQPRMIMHPYRPDLEGQDISDFVDPNGQHLFLSFVDVVERDGSGYVQYLWQWKDDPANITRKISYVKGFAPWGWIIGTGVYLEDVDAEISVLREHLVRISAAILAVVAALLLYIVRQTIMAGRRRDHLWDLLIQSKENYRELVENANSLILRIDTTGFVTFINEFAQEFFGYSDSEICGRSVFETILPKGDVKLRTSFLQTHGRKESLECVCFRKNGKRAWVFWTNRALEDEAGFVNGYLCVGTDYTQRREIEEERDRLMKDLAAKNKEMESLIYVTSHDLRSPLVNIQGFNRELSLACEALSELPNRVKFPPEEEERLKNLLEREIPKSLSYIAGSAKKMDQLLKSLLELSRLGRVELKFSEIDMNAMMKIIVEGMQYVIQQKNVLIEVENLPSCWGDAAQINQIFSNLLDNAIKYLSPDRPGRIKITGEEKEGNSLYCVEDNGIGIEGAHQGKIFEIFHQLHPKKTVGGEGIGLTIVQRIAARHGGTVRVDSTVGLGSRFYIAIPRKE